MAKFSKQYDPNSIEPRWQKYWDEAQTFKAEIDTARPKYFLLDMFPYPSGAGLHIGHPEGYTATDILGRYKKAKGFNVLHPMGWDAFGLPAEQYAIQTGTHPAETTFKNIENFKRQLKQIGFGIDWSRELSTTDEDFYRWTQWIFLNLFKRGLAYVDEHPVWWCEALGTVLSNEEVIDGKSERGSHPVVRKKLRQWILRITAYAQKLIDDLDLLDWPDSTKRMQRTWIGKSKGSNIFFEIDNEAIEERIKVYTTRTDTIYGATYVVLAPEHPLVERLTDDAHREEVNAYIKESAAKSDLARTDLAKDKTGVFTGSYVINPINGERIPIWVADYVLMSYGTGAVMAVPGNDARDNEFAKKYELEIRPIVKSKDHDEGVFHTDHGTLIDSGEFTGMETKKAVGEITKKLIADGGKAEFTTNFKLRDWLFSRQRYWGEPFPIVWVRAEDFEVIEGQLGESVLKWMPEERVTYQEEGVEYVALPIPDSELPLKLPEMDNFEPAGSGESPLAKNRDWVDVYYNVATGQTKSQNKNDHPGEGWVRASRETNTMPQWAGSCWYYLRYLDPTNADALVSAEAEAYWQGPDLYVGGGEHAVLHLLYARFWHKVLQEIGVVSTPEPFPKVVHQGLILGEPEHHGYKNDAGEWVSFDTIEKERLDDFEAIKLAEADVMKKGESFVLKAEPAVRVNTRMYKMSKSRGNVVNPDDVIAEYGADALRMYEMFLGPLEAMKPWNAQGIEGISRFLKKVWREYVTEEGERSDKISDSAEDSSELIKALHETIKKVEEDIEALRFNTAISQMMILLGKVQKADAISRDTAKVFVQLLAPFAPHLGEELWRVLGEETSVADESWPVFDASKLVESTVRLVVQVNGKLRAELQVETDIEKESALAMAESHERVKAHMEGKTVVKTIYVPGKIINYVVK